ncbi:nucleoside 2-deoxyribosyltransferase [Bacillus badius]|uniref:nucleoside 2-deoxyribosyltransferase n=1 Tax=Bacillus badius TaxID=1455 RepID=UPI001CBD5BE2|nr:nucleoside 2-deoxyribosyltransferase [Bacillus badius]UAT29522.1 nucleoside 2-deoxyribosyltransferase [Bacillus badius]
MSTCLVCNRSASVTSFAEWDYAVDCSFCGRYIISNGGKDYLDDSPYIKHKVKILMRERKINELKPIALFKEHPADSKPHINFSIVVIDELISTFPKNISDRLNRSLKNIASSSVYPGDKLSFTEDHLSLIFTQSLAENEAFFLLNQLISDGLITGHAGYPAELVVTVKGWNKIAELEEHDVVNDKQVFVAMMFKDEVEEAYECGIKEAITKTGFTPIRIDKKEHNNKIDDEIIAEIKRSKFVIADFTGHRGGVYFEAGFAMGLGKSVIWTCREDDLEDLHFDTRQYSHIVWKDPDDLREKLINRIRATI